MNRNFLKEAIADAKAVKESAIANAKAALEESFTPHLKNMLAMRLQEMEDMEEGYDEMEEAKMKKEGKHIPMKTEGEEMDEAEDMDEAKDMETEGEEMDEAKEMDEAEDMDELKDMDEAEEMDEAEGEEMNLDELLAELEKEEKEEKKKSVKEAEKEEKKKTVKEAEEEAEETEEEEVSLEDMTDDDLKAFIEDVIQDMVSAGELEAGDEAEGESEEVSEIGKMKKEGYQEKNNEGKEMKKEGKKLEKEGKEVEKENKELKKEVEEKDKELKEAYRALRSVKSELNEINLLNAKLLYTNKIFRSKTLTESQKVKVLTAFDKAINVSEVKLVYNTLVEGLKTTKKPVNESLLGSASKTLSSVKTTKQPIVESNEMIKRFQKLAGII